MTALQLYKFIKSNGVEWHWNHDKTDVYIFVYPSEIKEFSELIGSYKMDEGMSCTLTGGGYIAFEMKDACEYFGIDDMTEVFDPSEEV